MSHSNARRSALALCIWVLQCVAGWAAPSPKMLTEVADLSDVAISPDGRDVAFRQEKASVERNTYDTVWFVEPLDGHAPPIRVADGGEPLRADYGGAIIEPPQWSADGRWIYYRALIDGEVQVWRAAADGSRAQAVTHDPADIESFTLSRDGARLVYTVGATRAEIERAEREEYDRGILIDNTIPIGQGLYHSAFINGRLASVRMTGDWSGRAGLLQDAPRRQRLVDLSDLTVREASAPDLAALADVLPVDAIKADRNLVSGFKIQARSPISGAIAFLSLDGPSTRLRVTPGADTAAFTECNASACQNAAISGLAWRPGYNQVVFTTSDRDRGRAQSLYVWDLDRGTVRLVVRAEGLITGGRGESVGETCAIGHAFAACVTAAADTPPRLERVDLESGARQILYDPNIALAQSVGPRAQFLRWTDANGQVFTGQFFPPVQTHAASPAPLFVTYYVCPGYLRGGVGDEWPLASLAGAGIAALCVNEPGRDMRNLNQLDRYGAAMSGVSAIVEQLTHRGLIDPRRVGMGGLSFGSEVVMWAAMKTDLLAAASVTSTSVTPTYFRFHSLQGAQFRDTLKHIWGLGSPEETPDRWKLLSPAFNVDRIHTPLLMQMPEQESLQAIDYFGPLANSTTPAEMYLFPNEPHHKFQPRHKLAAYQRNLDWFRFWLEDYVDPDPLKVDQYKRWLAMKARTQDRQTSGIR